MTNSTVQYCKLLIIGAGPAGYTASIYDARSGLNPVQVMGHEPGGQLMITTDVENYPGFEDVIQGPWLMDQMEKQARKVGVDLVYDYINKVDFSEKPFKCWGEGGKLYQADSIIISTGAKAKWLGLESESYYQGYGVSGCATCDGFFFKGKEVVVVGGGNTAVEEAIHLTHHASKITLIHRRDKLRAEKILQEKLLAHPKINVMWNSKVDEVLGIDQPHKKVTGLKISNLLTQETTQLSAEGVFIAIGHNPQTEIFKPYLDHDAEGYLVTKTGTTLTNIPGIFAAGDVQDKIYRQAITAAGQGCMAALDVQKYLDI